MGYHVNRIFSGKDIYLNYDKWTSGEINKLLIIGMSGSGKSTLSRKLADKFDCAYIDTDKFRGNVWYTDKEMKQMQPYIYYYFTNIWDKGDRHNIKNMDSEERRLERNKFIYWLLNHPTRMIIEGAAINDILYTDEELKKYPIILKGSSMLKSMSRMSWREFTRENSGKDRSAIDNLLWWGKWCTKYSKMRDQENKLRDKIMDGFDMDNYEEIEESVNWKNHLWNNNSVNQRNIFLTSAGLENKKVRKVFLDSYNKNINTSKVLFVTAAAIDKESIAFLDECWKDLLSIGINSKNIIEFNFDRQFTYNDFIKFDIVYICGGDENHLINVINNSGMRNDFIDAINNGLVYIGVSAGACIGSPYVKNGLNFINNKVDVHYSENECTPNGILPPDNIQINLSNNQAVWIYNNHKEIIGE